MTIIRDCAESSISISALLIDWGVRRCNYKACRRWPNTLIAEPKTPLFGLCESHFQQGNIEGGTTLDLEWDGFDAFGPQEEQSDGS